MTDPEGFMADVARRLRAIAARPNYRFKRTSRAVAARYVEQRTRFVGFSEPEIRAIEARLGGSLPRFYRAFLAAMGRCSGELFCGSDLPGPTEFPAFQLDAEKLLAEEETGLSLPSRSIVILNHQGSSFAFLRAAPAADGPVLTYCEGESSFREASTSFEAFVEEELSALERAHEGSLSSGGYFLTVYPDGSGRREYPARNSGIRPLNFEDDFTD